MYVCMYVCIRDYNYQYVYLGYVRMYVCIYVLGTIATIVCM